MDSKYYVVDAATINIRLLRDLGYTIIHRPHLSLTAGVHTRKKWMLCPDRKTGVDAAEAGAKAMSFDEYLDLFENNKGGQNK